jgi:uncharacterized membrane protein
MGTPGMKGSQMNAPRQTGKGCPRCALMVASFAFAILSIPPLGDRAAVFGQCKYELTAIISAPPCKTSNSPTFARGLNIHGHVTGYYRPCAIGNDRAFFWSQETGFVTLPTPPGVFRAWAYAISDTGFIVGQHDVTGVGSKGFIYDMNKNNGEYIYLEPVHEGVVVQNLSSANAVNSEGVVAGMRVCTEPGVTPARYNAVIWRPLEKGAPVQDLGVVDGPNSSALGILNHEEPVAVGWDGFSVPTTIAYIWKDGEAISLGPVPGADSSHAVAVNNSSVVVGRGANFSKLVWRAFVWHEGRMTVIPPIAPFTNSSGLSLNDLGQVGLTMSHSGVFRGFIWQHGKVIDVNSLLVDPQGITVQSVASINNRGQIRADVGTKAAILSPMDVPLGDLNYDCIVDVQDLWIMLEQWGPVKPNISGSHATNGVPTADLNGDGVVNVTDLLILFDNWSP